MNIGLIGSFVALCVTVGGVVVAAEDRYAHKQALELKADSSTVQALQVHIISDKIDDLNIKKFMLEQKAQHTELDKYRLEQIKSRLNQTKKTLERLTHGN